MAWCAEGPEFDSEWNLFLFFSSFFFPSLLRLVCFLVIVVLFYFFILLKFFQIYEFSSLLLYFPFNRSPEVLREVLRFTYF